MTDENRTVADLDAECEVWIADASPNRCVAHLDADCFLVADEAKPRTPAVLHPNLRLCKECDPAYEVPRPGGRDGLAWQLRQHGGGE